MDTFCPTSHQEVQPLIMQKTFLVTFVWLTMAGGLALGAPKYPTKRGTHEYGPPIHISSSVLSFQQDEGGLHDANGEWTGIDVEAANHGDFADAADSGYLKFAGVVGSGHIYIPSGSSDHHAGTISASQW